MITSSTASASTPARSSTARTTCPPSTGASVSLNEPRKDLASAVRAVETMTTSFMGFSLVKGIEGVAADGIHHAARAVGALDFHGHAHGLLHRRADLLDLDHFSTTAHPRSDRYRRGETYPVAAVVDAHLHVLHLHQLGQKQIG